MINKLRSSTFNASFPTLRKLICHVEIKYGTGTSLQSVMFVILLSSLSQRYRKTLNMATTLLLHMLQSIEKSERGRERGERKLKA